jgi:hypothetical protein
MSASPYSFSYDLMGLAKMAWRNGEAGNRVRGGIQRLEAKIKIKIGGICDVN